MVHKGDLIENKRTGQRMTFLQTAKETGGELLEIECYSPPTDAREPEHIHPHQANSFRILSGQLHFSIEGKVRVANPGDEITIPPGVPHLFWNAGTIGANYIQEFRPAINIAQLFETFFALSRENKLGRGGAPNILRTARIMLAHHNELRLVSPSWTIQRLLFVFLAPIGRLLGFGESYQ